MKRNLTKFSFDDHDLWILSRNQISIICLLQAGTRKYISEFDDVAIRSEKKSKIFLAFAIAFLQHHLSLLSTNRIVIRSIRQT
jgi:hypothetical protein